MTIVVSGVVSATTRLPGSTNRWLIRPVNGATTLVNVEIQLRGGHVGHRRFQRRFRLLFGGLVLIAILLADRTGRVQQAFGPGIVGFGLLENRLVEMHLPDRAVVGRLIGPRIDFAQHVSLIDHRPFGEVHFVEISRNPSP